MVLGVSVTLFGVVEKHEITHTPLPVVGVQLKQPLF